MHWLPENIQLYKINILMQIGSKSARKYEDIEVYIFYSEHGRRHIEYVIRY